jgi:hypothetical protein
MTTRRALLITYHFPPDKAAGAQRWDVFTRAAVARGWEVDVITAAEPGEALPQGVRAFHVPYPRHWLNRASDFVLALRDRLTAKRSAAIGEHGAAEEAARAVAENRAAAGIDRPVFRREDISWPTTVTDLRRNLRAVLFYTDILPWMHAASAAAQRLLAQHRYDVVLSSGPPHVSAEAARKAAATAGLPLILDFRDPWSLIDVIDQQCASPTYFKLAGRLERRTVRAARLVVMNTMRAAQTMREAHPYADVIAVPNGFAGPQPQPRHPADRFIVMFTGTIYLDRDPRPLLSALARLTPELGLSAENFAFRLVGIDLTYGGYTPEQLAEKAGIPPGMVTSHPPMPRAALFEEMTAAALLVNLPQGEKQCVPSKVYEYVHFPAWVLGLELPDSATHDVLTSVGADIAEPHDVETIAALLRARILAYRAGERPAPLAAPDQYSSPIEGQRFFAAVEQRLDQITAP